jgi:hypothetical protein
MKSKQSGKCPTCGAPIFSKPVLTDPNGIPETVFTCTCRFYQNQPKFVPVEVPRYVPVQPYVIPPTIYPQPIPWTIPTWDPTCRMGHTTGFILWNERNENFNGPKC